MKQLIILLLLLPFLAAAQNDSLQALNTSVISTEQFNMVYRGISTPVKIAFPGALSFTASATGFEGDYKPSLVKDTLLGGNNYILHPYQGDEITITVIGIMSDGTSKTEHKVFKIKAIPRIKGTINGDTCDNCLIPMSKEELIHSTIKATMDLPFLNEDSRFFTIHHFEVEFPKDKIIKVVGNTMSDEAIKNIKKLKRNDTVIISHIRYGTDPTVDYASADPIVIQITHSP